MLRKELIYVLVALLFSSCKQYSYFSTANDVLKADSQVFLINGQELNGKLTVQFETGQFAKNTISLHLSDNSFRQIPVDSVRCYRHKTDWYYPKQADLEAYQIPYRDKVYTPEERNLLFVKRLSSEQGRIGFYELYQSNSKSPDGKEHYYYYVSFPSDDRHVMWKIGSDKFLPDFDTKMSKLLSDCPLLAEKIRNKSDGYALSQISLDLKKYEVFKKVVTEYNNCK